MLGKKRQERPQGSGTPPLRAGARLRPGRGKKRPFRRRSDRSFLARRPLSSSSIMVSALISTLEAFFSWRRHGEMGKRLRGHHGDMVMQERASWRKEVLREVVKRAIMRLALQAMYTARAGPSL
jgi:hypothetical protein